MARGAGRVAGRRSWRKKRMSKRAKITEKSSSDSPLQPVPSERRSGAHDGVKVPAHLLFRKKLSLVVWKPHGILNEAIVNEIVAFIETAERRALKPFNRFTDLSAPALDAVDLNFKFVFQVALFRRISAGPKPPVKSAFYVTSPAASHYAKLHAMLTDYSPLDVSVHTDLAAAAKWLGVPVDALTIS